MTSFRTPRTPRTPIVTRQAEQADLGQRSLFSVYLGNDVNILDSDRRFRPDHYTEEQVNLIDRLKSGVTKLEDVPPHQLADLVITYSRRTTSAPVRKAVESAAKKITPPSASRRPVVFEDQGAKDVVIV